VRVWDIFDKKGSVESLPHGAEVTSVELHPNTKDVISTTLSGQVYIWSTEDSQLKGVLECKDDIVGGRL